MEDEQSLIKSVNGKVVYLVKVTDQITTKLGHLTDNIKNLDSTFRDWQKEINQFAKQEKCHYSSALEMFSKVTFETNKVFSSILRLIAIQDTIAQISRLQDKELIGLNDLPHFLLDAITARLKTQTHLSLTLKALRQGYPLFINPIIDYELRANRYINLNILVTLPKLKNLNSLCTVEYLVPVKYKVNQNCFSGPLTREDFALISCPSTKTIIATDALTKCYSHANSFVCPANVLTLTKTNEWLLGIPWVPGSRIQHARNHKRTSCSKLERLFHLGGRYYLSTKQQNFKTQNGTMAMTPLSVYQLPCNFTTNFLEVGLSQCPTSVTFTLPLFSKDHVTYVPWSPSANEDTLQLHYNSLKIFPSPKLNKTVLREHDRTYQRLDGHLASQLRSVKKHINKIHETGNTTTTDIVAYTALTLVLLNTVALLSLTLYLYSKNKPSQTPQAKRENERIFLTNLGDEEPSQTPQTKRELENERISLTNLGDEEIKSKQPSLACTIH